MTENDRLMSTSPHSSLTERRRRRSTAKLAMNQFLPSSFEFKELLFSAAAVVGFAVQICSSNPAVTFLALARLSRWDVTESTTDRDRTGQIIALDCTDEAAVQRLGPAGNHDNAEHPDGH
jgi:hypothetical protein